MAKTIEELKEMIDSVIVENGRGQITGQGLNLVLNEMSDALGEMGGCEGVYLLHVPMNVGEELSEEQIAFNAQQFAILEPKFQNKEFVQIGFVGDLSFMGFACVVCPQVLYGDFMETGSNSILLVMSSMAYAGFMLNSDGTILMAQ